jgi:hypothetical protein
MACFKAPELADAFQARFGGERRSVGLALGLINRYL